MGKRVSYAETRGPILTI